MVGTGWVVRSLRDRSTCDGMPPSTQRHNGALWLDEVFDLRERVTTSLELSPEDAATDAGKALLADSLQRVKGLNVRERFPVRIGRRGWLLPSSATAFALVALFYSPPMPIAKGTTEAKSLSEADNWPWKRNSRQSPSPSVIRSPKTLVKSPRTLNGSKQNWKKSQGSPAIRPSNCVNASRISRRSKTKSKNSSAMRGEKSKLLQQQLQMKDQLVPSDGADRKGLPRNS